MEKVIWKYELQTRDRQELQLPVDNNLLAIQKQNDILCAWYLVDPKSPKYQQEILMFGTGHTIINIDSKKYLSTVQDWQFVWHFFYP